MIASGLLSSRGVRKLGQQAVDYCRGVLKELRSNDSSRDWLTIGSKVRKSR